MSHFPDQNHLTPDQHHLTPDQLDDHLIGDLDPTAAAHLAACALCANRAAAAASPIASFQQVSTAWSERRSATLPIPVATAQRPVWQRHMAWATASLSLAFGVAFINASHQFSSLTTYHAAPATAAVQQPAASLAAAPQPNQIADDNHLLQAINASLDPSTDSTANLGLTATTTVRPGPPTYLQD